MRVGELSRRTSASVRSLRYYEECGLIVATRSGGGQRHYDDVVARVSLVRQLLAAGLATSAIIDVLPCLAEPSSQTSALTERLIEERDRLAEEIAQRAALERIIESAPPLAADGRTTDRASLSREAAALRT